MICKHKPEVGVFILDDVTVVDTVATGGDAVEITTGQVTGLDVVVVVVVTAVVKITGVATCDKTKAVLVAWTD